MRKLATIAVVLAVVAVSSQASVISVNFAADSSGSGGASKYYGDTDDTGQMADTDVAGVVAASNWTNALGLTPSLTSLKDDSGADTTMSLELTPAVPNAGWMMGEDSWKPSGSGDAQMMYAARAVGGSEGSFQLDLSNIPYAEYDIYVYVSRKFGWGNSEDNSTTIDGTSYYYSTTESSPGNLPDAYKQATSTDPDNVTADATYVLFEGLTGSSKSIIQAASSGNEGGITGIQVFEVPEPATMSLLALGGLGALLRRKRRTA